MSHPRTPRLMLQGTGSDVGKSLIVAGLARVFANRGLRVSPFKPQNMSNNAAVTSDGGEIGRAQALQALAARVPLTVDMNPVLLKPQSETGSQVIVQGRIFATAKARDYQTLKIRLLPKVLESFDRLCAKSDLVLVEGAGSASETNLRANDIANMGFARAADCPVILIGDIDRGGVIASLVGTHAVLDADDDALIKGFIVNRMRGDPTLFAEGMRRIANDTGWQNIGLLPHLPDAAKLPAEDALSLSLSRSGPSAGPERGQWHIAVPVLPRISNFDDLDPLRLDGRFHVDMVMPGSVLPATADLVILAGSKATIADLADFRRQGWDIDLAAHIRRGGQVLGLCGGYQMLGQAISDPDGIEGPVGEVAGLGHLAVSTRLTGQKSLTEVRGKTLADGQPFHGYEMHVGVTEGADCARPYVQLENGALDGARNGSGRVSGTYAHGFFADSRQRDALARRLGSTDEQQGPDYAAQVDAALEALAQHLEAHLDIEAIAKIAGL